MSEKVVLKGTLKWVRTHEPEEFQGKKSWKATIVPDQESLQKVMELQARGCKNQLKMDTDGEGKKFYYINFSRPTEKKKKTGEVFKTFTPPVVKDRSGNVISEMIANGAKGDMILEISSFKGSFGNVTTAMFDGLVLDEWQKYESAPAPQAEAY
jgi:hypothetical protein